MKILYLTGQIYKHGGIEKVLSQKANYLAEVYGYEVHIVTYNQLNNSVVYEFSNKIKFKDLGINYVEGKSYFHSVNLLKSLKHKFMLQKTIKEINPDIIVSCSYGPDFFFLPNISGLVPVIKEFHSSRFFDSKSDNSTLEKLKNNLFQKAEQKFEAIVVLNEDEKTFYDNRRIEVIANPTELSHCVADISSKRILAAGRIAPVKNFGDLIDCFSVLHSDFPDWELHFFGEDYLGTQQELQCKIDKANLQNHVYFKGITDDLQKEMQHYSIYAMTSETECFPMVLLESLSVGLPVITYDSPTGPKFIVTDSEDSFLVPYKDKIAFSEKLSLLMHSEDLRAEMSAAAKKNSERFDIKRIMNLWNELFLSLMTQNKA